MSGYDLRYKVDLEELFSSTVDGGITAKAGNIIETKHAESSGFLLEESAMGNEGTGIGRGGWSSSSNIATGSRREILYSESFARCLLGNEMGPRGGASWILVPSLSMSKLPPKKRQKLEWDALGDETKVHASVQRRKEILQGSRKALERSVARKAYMGALDKQEERARGTYQDGCKQRCRHEKI
ncbi:hypothetical protein K438DRAFT_1770975 [Mycena galopus ATCC 62051]|nr:hypothetical protein K438DRAFT_1770975 [Mycena galopus ATCC 62051]